jgi:hypothetical protein
MTRSCCINMCDPRRTTPESFAHMDSTKSVHLAVKPTFRYRKKGDKRRNNAHFDSVELRAQRRRDGKGAEEEATAEPANQRQRPCVPPLVRQGMLSGPRINHMLTRLGSPRLHDQEATLMTLAAFLPCKGPDGRHVDWFALANTR